MLSAILMFRRVAATLRYAVEEEEFLNIASAGLLLVMIGTVTYTFGADWNVVDSLDFAVTTLTTTSVGDPDLALEDGWLKLFTIGFQLLGIGILVEVLRRLGFAFLKVRSAEKAREQAAS